MFTKWWKFTTKKHSITSLIFIFKFQIFGIRFIISKKNLKFKNMFNVGIAYGFKVGVINIFKKIFMKSNPFSFKFMISFFWQNDYCLHFSLNLH